MSTGTEPGSEGGVMAIHHVGLHHCGTAMRRRSWLIGTLLVATACSGTTTETTATTATTATGASTSTTRGTVGSTTTTGATTGTTVPMGTTCPDIAFAPASDNVASHISAAGLGCADAEALVRQVAAGHNIVSGARTFSMGGFDCTVVTDDTGALPVGRYSCHSGAKVVTWTKN